ncbi:hypothetical protein Q8A73_004151 [Channa argus]|nr:hypothetical protein Q8A73_004151 [Channa argus]
METPAETRLVENMPTVETTSETVSTEATTTNATTANTTPAEMKLAEEVQTDSTPKDATLAETTLAEEMQTETTSEYVTLTEATLADKRLAEANQTGTSPTEVKPTWTVSTKTLPTEATPTEMMPTGTKPTVILSTITTGTTTKPSATKTEEVDKDDYLSRLEKETFTVSPGIRKFVESWDSTPTIETTNGGLTEKTNTTTTSDRFRGEWEEAGSEVRARDWSYVGSDVGTVVRVDKVPKLSGTLESALESSPDSPCVPVPSDWSICSSKQSKVFSLPNFFNHTSVEEVGVVLQEWAWLTRAGCHNGVEWFLCLLLVPGCPSAALPLHLPCRSFCHMLQDSCWASLENGRLPVECHLLPESAQEPGRPACVSVSNRKGNPGGRICGFGKRSALEKECGDCVLGLGKRAAVSQSVTREPCDSGKTGRLLLRARGQRAGAVAHPPKTINTRAVVVQCVVDQSENEQSRTKSERDFYACWELPAISG